MSIPCFTLETACNLLKLPEHSWQTIDHDWQGDTLPFIWQFFLGCDEKKLHYVTRSNCNLTRHPSARYNDFVEGLWQYTLCELFLFLNQRTEYLELNLAPNGAWWAAEFSDYRTVTRPRSDLALSPLAYYNTENSFWYAGCSVELPAPFHLDAVTVSVCGISQHEGERFIAANPLSQHAADFHLREAATPLQIKDLAML